VVRVMVCIGRNFSLYHSLVDWLTFDFSTAIGFEGLLHHESWIEKRVCDAHDARKFLNV